MSAYTRWVARACAFVVVLAASAQCAFAQPDITTERYDPSRLGANLAETQLTTSNVNLNSFGKVWSYTVSGSIYAQPLYVQGVTIPGQGTHNLLYVATMNDIVYAFDADSGTDAPLLTLDITTQVAGSTPVPINDVGSGAVNIVGNLGIESTPYIDRASNTMYLVAQTKEPNANCGTVNPHYCHRLHALDITTLTEKTGSPSLIQGSVPGTGPGSSGGTLTFDPLLHNQRSSLAFANGLIFVAWSSHEDAFNYHGWIMSYDATTLQQNSIWSTTPNGSEAGVWMGGRAPAVDAAGNVYYITGNGSWDGTVNFGESFLKFGTTAGAALLDWFTPSNYNSLTGADLDLGGSGPILIPGTDLIIGGGKNGTFYMTHTANLGHELAGDLQIVQTLDNGSGQMKGGPIYWNRAGGVGPWLYVWADDCSYLNAYHFNGTTFDTPPVSQSSFRSWCGGSSGAVLALSANGSTPGSGIVWASIPTGADHQDPNGGVHQGILRAFDADNLGTELWNSNQNATRDSSGNWPKFSVPTVVNGRVYMGSFPSDGIGNTSLNVYGLMVPDFTLTAAPPNPGTNPGGLVTYTINTGSVNSFGGPIHLSVSGLPSNATGTFASNDFATPGTTILTVQTTVSTPLGSSTLVITGTSGTLPPHTASVGLLVTATTPGAGVISVDFVGGGTPMAATEIAGVLARPNWNIVPAATGSALALADETGTPTGATMAWVASSGWQLGIADTPGDFRMMNGYLDAIGQSTTVNISNLPTDSAGYLIYVYADGNNGTATRTGTYQISGSGIATTSIDITDAPHTNFGGTFKSADNSAGNYAVFFVGAQDFTLTAIPGTASDNTPRAPLNAIQIVHGDRIFANGFD